LAALEKDYRRLLAAAEKDRQILLGVLDTIGVRLDELVPDPEVAKARVLHYMNLWKEDRADSSRWQEIDQEDESTWPPNNEWTLNWNESEWYVEVPGNFRGMVDESPEHFHGIKYLILSFHGKVPGGS